MYTIERLWIRCERFVCVHVHAGYERVEVSVWFNKLYIKWLKNATQTKKKKKKKKKKKQKKTRGKPKLVPRFAAGTSNKPCSHGY